MIVKHFLNDNTWRVDAFFVYIDHGKFLIRVRLSEQPDGKIRVSRLTYEATSEAAEAYARRADKAEPEVRRPSGAQQRRRRRSRLPEKKD